MAVICQNMLYRLTMIAVLYIPSLSRLFLSFGVLEGKRDYDALVLVKLCDSRHSGSHVEYVTKCHMDPN